ncbi:MAG: magnesium transporter [Sulfurimonas sp.]|jgi:magnesium transporter
MDNLKQLIDKLHLEDLQNELHPSIFDENELYDMLIVRIPVITTELTSKSLGFIVTKEQSYFYNKEKKIFEEFPDRFLGVYSIIDKNIDRLLKSFIKYQERVADMEENLYVSNTDADFLNNWLSIKLEILRIERVLHRTVRAMDDFIEYNRDVDDFPMNNYVDIHEHIERTIHSATLQLSKLDYLYSFYNAKSNDKINRMIYILTIISAIFLPLNLVVGFFGMNTSGLPFASGANGTYFAISLMITLAAVTSFVVFKWRKKVEK